MKKIKICVIGTGKWGENHIKTLIKLNVDIGCFDINKDRLIKLKKNNPELRLFKSLESAFEENFDGFIIATPPSSHYDLAKLIIKNHKPVLVEKPLAMSVLEAEKIKLLVKKYKGKLIVGHLLLFHPAIQKIKSMIDDGEIGNIQYMYSNRLNLGRVRKEENVFWSLAPHDISLFQYFSNSFPYEVTSMGGDFLQKNIHDTTITYLKYLNKFQGHIYVSWLHPFKEHRLVIIGSKGTLHFEDSARSKPLLFYEKDDLSKDSKIFLKNKNSRKIEYESTMPLKNELKYFIEVINGKKISKVNIDEGLDVIRVLEMASNSLKSIKKNEK
tara:strand:- start:233 stop:1213 length:981 start_codon:yes stop_codon:yes gene_type:complete